MKDRFLCTDQVQKRRPRDSADYRLSVIIPAWNQEESILLAIQTTSEALAATTASYEIIVVDDGSADRTSDIVRAAAALDPHVRLVRNDHQLGYGAALCAGFQAATLDLVSFIDAHSQLDADELAYMLPLTRCYDVTCGYRVDRQESTTRLLSWGYNTLITGLMGSPVRDINCPCKLFHRTQLQDILPESDTCFANAEMVTKARLQGLSIVEVGVRQRPGRSVCGKFSWRKIPKTLSSLLPFWWSRVLFRAPNPQVTAFGGWSWAALLLLIVIAGTLLFTHLSHPLFKPDEIRYAEIGRKMLDSGDWVVPMLDDEPYYDKPPLFYWLTAASFWLLGKTELAARLVPALAAFLTVLMTFAFGRRIVGARAGFFAALALSLTPGFVLCGRFIVLDSVFTLFVVASLFAAYEAIRGIYLSWLWWVVSAIMCAVALVTKGPVALVLIAPPVVAYGWLNRSSARPKLLHWMAYAGIALCLVAPWYLAVIFRDPAFAYHFFVKHHLLRFLTGEYHDNPLWFYVPVLLISCFPWSLLSIPIFRFYFSRMATMGMLRPQAMGFFLLWAGWCVLFFSLSRGKLPPYVLPCLPPLAILVGCYLDCMLALPAFDTFFQVARSRVPRQAIVTIAFAWLIVSTVGWYNYAIEITEYLIEASLCVLCILGVAVWGRKMPTKMAWAACTVVLAAVVYESAHELVPDWSRQRSPIAGSAELAKLVQDKDTAIASYDHWQLTLPLAFDLGQPLEFRDRSEDLKLYLSKQVRSLLVTRNTEDVDSMHSALPAGMEIKQVLDAGRTRVFLIQAATSNEPKLPSYQ